MALKFQIFTRGAKMAKRRPSKSVTVAALNLDTKIAKPKKLKKDEQTGWLVEQGGFDPTKNHRDGLLKRS